VANLVAEREASQTKVAVQRIIPKNINMMLPQAAYRGPRPPLLPDYLDDLVAASAKLPAVQKLIVIHALELSTLG
jgi:hypothetical protein